jgi:hypothetical protein
MPDERERDATPLTDALLHLARRLQARTKPMDPEARDILYANLWDLYDDPAPDSERASPFRATLAAMDDDALRTEVGWPGATPMGFRQACADELARRADASRASPARFGSIE